MTNFLKDMSPGPARKLLGEAAREGLRRQGYALERMPGRGLSNNWRLSKNGETQIAVLRTTRDRDFAFTPLGGGAWKTLDDVDLVLVSAVDDKEDPRHVGVYLFPAAQIRAMFDAAHAGYARQGHNTKDHFPMWASLDHHGGELMRQHPPIARFTIEELKGVQEDGEAEEEEPAPSAPAAPAFSNIPEILAWARARISELTGMPEEAIRLEVKMGG